MLESPKYPRTFHTPWSKGATDDDKIQYDLSRLLGCDVVLTQKMDGSNVCLERDHCFARAHSSPPSHPSFDAFKQLHAGIRGYIPKNVQIFGEWLYALHSIAYDKLPSYLMMFGVRDTQTNEWGSWDEVCMWGDELGIPTVPVLERSKFQTSKEIEERIAYWMQQPSLYSKEIEGVVTRVAREFPHADFSVCVSKYVRANHVNSNDQHWKKNIVVRNGFKSVCVKEK